MIGKILFTTILSLLPVFAFAAPRWVSTWSAAPERVWGPEFPFPTGLPPHLADQTFVQRMQISVGGQALRVVISNRYGESPMHIRRSTVRTVDGMSKPVTLLFGGSTEVRIPAGADAHSDPVPLQTANQQLLELRNYVHEATPVTSFHWDGRNASYLLQGDRTGGIHLPEKTDMQARTFVTRIDVMRSVQTRTVAILGDSITDGNGVPVDLNGRISDHLATFMAPLNVSVLNSGISGAQLLGNAMGDNALTRLQRDLFSLPHLDTLVVLIGINDIAWPGTPFAPNAPMIPLSQLQHGYGQLVAQAHSRGIQVVGVTLLPFADAMQGTPITDYYSTSKDSLRRELNEWMRTSGTFDAVVDGDALLRNSLKPLHLQSIYDSGDHLHPSPAGNAELARALSEVLHTEVRP